MITLFTGTPGTGKTALVIKELLEFRKNNSNLLIFVHGIRNLRGITHEKIYCRSQLCDVCQMEVVKLSDLEKAKIKYVEDWVLWKQQDSLIVIDEVQRIWRPRVGSSKITEAVSALETHRHYGVDFWLISQGSHLFDNFIRLLIGRHIHLVATWSGRRQYEWAECQKDTRAGKSSAVIRPYKLPKEVFNLYDSAELHTSQVKRKPIVFYAVIALVIIVLGFFYKVYVQVNQHQDEHKIQSLDTKMPEKSQSSTPIAENKETYPDFKPTVEGVPESAPAYQSLLKVVDIPVLVGCVYSKRKDDCRCYTSQATIYPTAKEYCIETVKGHRFNPFLKHDVIQPPLQEVNHESKELTNNAIIVGSAK